MRIAIDRRKRLFTERRNRDMEKDKLFKIIATGFKESEIRLLLAYCEYTDRDVRNYIHEVIIEALETGLNFITMEKSI